MSTKVEALIAIHGLSHPLCPEKFLAKMLDRGMEFNSLHRSITWENKGIAHEDIPEHGDNPVFHVVFDVAMLADDAAVGEADSLLERSVLLAHAAMLHNQSVQTIRTSILPFKSKKSKAGGRVKRS